MNAFNIVNLAAACVLTSVEYARELGIPEDKWIYPRAGAGYCDADHCMYACVFDDIDMLMIQSGTVRTFTQVRPSPSPLTTVLLHQD